MKSSIGKYWIAPLSIFLLMFFVHTGHAAETKKKTVLSEDRPERLLTMALEYPGIEVAQGQSVSMNLLFHNGGKTMEFVQVWVSAKPSGWRTRLKTDQYTVTGLSVPAGEDKSIIFEAEPDKSIRPGDYNFLIEAKTQDERFLLKQPLTIKVREADKATMRGLKLSTSYPILQAPSNMKFEFSIEVENKLGKDAIVNLSAQVPEGWEVNIKPSYEPKTISSLKIRANDSQTISLEVNPIKDARAGEYPIIFRAQTEDARSEIRLTCVLTGTYSIEAGTATGLLSLEVNQGKKATVSIFVKNTGTATLKNVKFTAYKPENWKVEFKPEVIPVLEPREIKQVEATITPADEALVGDYSVNIVADGDKAVKNLEFRVSVKASTTWGWIGLGIILVVIAGLTFMFRWIGRR
ncbi:MAG: NEW3 domain-containing protein [Syntrophales bacterium]|nr:NEW3 domain-containing protein [Syntrophales bacterium]